MWTCSSGSAEEESAHVNPEGGVARKQPCRGELSWASFNAEIQVNRLDLLPALTLSSERRKNIAMVFAATRFPSSH